jgi:hypothetical protein
MAIRLHVAVVIVRGSISRTELDELDALDAVSK